MKRLTSRKSEPYDPVKVIHDSTPKKFATAGKYYWTPTDDSESGKNCRRKWLLKLYGKLLPAKWLKQEDEERRRKLAEIMKAVERDKVLIALETVFDARIGEIQKFYEEAQAREKG